MDLDKFDFDLPDDLIAQNPVKPRDSSRLMLLDRSDSSVQHKKFVDILDIFSSDHFLVFNQSKVIPARILFNFKGKKAEIFLVRVIESDKWLCMIKPSKAFDVGDEFLIDENLSASILDNDGSGLWSIKFNLNKGVLYEYINKIGATPFPPYLKNTTASKTDYQTVYANIEGSVAAPTAGLHFTKDILNKIKNNGVGMAFVTLHVGPGTFVPVRTKNIFDHKMHSEYYEIDEHNAKMLNEALKLNKKIVAVGTTSVRVLESNFDGFKFKSCSGDTDIFITPKYEWKVVDAILTNFHLPKSTLLMLACSFGGTDFVLSAYNEAINQNYRFFSFGDSMLIL